MCDYSRVIIRTKIICKKEGKSLAFSCDMPYLFFAALLPLGVHAMSKVAVKIAARKDAKSALLAAKRERAENAHADMLAYCEQNKIRGTEKAALVAFASTAMQAASDRGAIAKAAFAQGKAASFTYAALAKAAKVSLATLSTANLAYIARNVAFRADLVGFVFAYDADAETVSVRPYKAAQKAAPRKARKAAPLADKAASEGDKAA